MTIDEFIKLKSKKLKEIPDAFLSSVGKSQKSIYDNLSVLLSKLRLTLSGSIIPSKENLQVASQITEELKKVVYGSEYVTAVSDFADEFDNLKPINEKYFEKAFPLFSVNDYYDSILKSAKTNIVTNLIAGAIEPEFINPIHELLDSAINSGAGFLDTVKQIRAYVEGGETGAGKEIDGKLLHYAKQLAHDSFAISDRSYVNAVANDLGLEWYFYDGVEVYASRCFCLLRKGKYYHKNEIASWGKGENIGGGCGFPWQGMHIDTNESTIFQLAGGYNCLDSIMPVSIIAVPIEDIRSAIKKWILCAESI